MSAMSHIIAVQRNSLGVAKRPNNAATASAALPKTYLAFEIGLTVMASARATTTVSAIRGHSRVLDCRIHFTKAMNATNVLMVVAADINTAMKLSGQAD